MMFLKSLMGAAGLALALTALPAAAEPTEGFAPNVKISDLDAKAPGDPIIFSDGSQGSLRDYAGEVLVVTLWRHDCGACQSEMPKLDRLSAEMAGEGVRVIALGLDPTMEMIESYLNERELNNLTPVMDLDKFNGSMLTAVHYNRFSIATPTSFIVGKDGVVEAKIWGWIDWDGEDARGYLRSLAQS